MTTLKIGYALCGSFCTIEESLKQLRLLKKEGYDITAIPSPIVCSANTRFTVADKLIKELENITEKKIIRSVEEAEPIGPKKLFDILTVCPCTSNTISKLTYGIVDNNVTMAVKSHLRNSRPVVIAPATNDALGASAKNIGQLLNYKNIYFVPFRQDDPNTKERSMIADFTLLHTSILNAINGKQTSPIIV